MVKGKKTKKKNLRLRRQLRKTFGCLFMISALLVTAIPVTPVEAGASWDTTQKHFVTSVNGTGGVIPKLDSTNTVYQTGDQMFRFAYVNSEGKEDPNTTKFAVLVGYTKTQSLPGGNLTIPSTVDAYVKYTDTQGSDSRLAAANKEGKPLFYAITEKQEVVVRTEQQIQQDGSTTTVEIKEQRDVIVSFSPCTYVDKGNWCPDGRNDVDLYYWNETAGNPAAPTSPVINAPQNEPSTSQAYKDWLAKWTVVGMNDGRLRDIAVSYIGNQFAVDDKAGGWKIDDQNSECGPGESVFGGTGEGKAAANIINLTISDNLLGIGNYAFYNCNNLSNIRFGNGLNTMGNYAFANCGNLRTVDMPYNTMLNTLGDHAFYNCGNLQSFAIPTYTEAIGDSCFENCTAMKTIDLIRKDAVGDLKSSLKRIGYKAFANCRQLQNLTLPDSYDGMDHNNKNVFHLSTVQGCGSLKFISTPSEKLDFVTDAADTNGEVDGTYGFTEFRADVGDEFYIEAPGYVAGTNNGEKTPAHNTANVRHIAFKYYGEDKYEIVEDAYGKKVSVKDGVVTEGDPIKDLARLVYAVDSGGNLLVFRIEDENGNVKPTVSVDGSVEAYGIPELTMPEKIGPYGIVTLAEGSFSDNCWIEKVTIPGSVQYINSGAFKGSHNLKHVIFSNASNIENIGDGAFATQQIKTTAPAHATGGQNGDSCRVETFLNETPFLSFTGDIEKDNGTNTEPFKYAMKSANNINAGEQARSYITYYSGLPTNLTVKYNPETQMSELQDFPTMAGTKTGFVADENAVGTYKPVGSTKTYKYPYITDAISTEIMGTESGGTENQARMKAAIENIVIPNGVNSIKEGLFSGLDKDGYIEDADGNKVLPPSDYESPAPDVLTLTVKSVAEIEPYTFARMSNLATAYVSGAATIGDYAFDKCPELANAEISADTTTLGLRPFSGCTKLTNVTFPDSSSFTAENGIIYGLDGEGARTKVVECLESRGSAVGSRVVGPDEFNGIKEIAPEAFMACDFIRQVDLTSSGITEVPVRCFAEDRNLNIVSLPNTAKAIRDGSFWNTASLASVKIPDSVSVISPNAFAEVPKDDKGIYGDPLKNRETMMPFDFIALPGSTADLYAVDYDYINVTQDDSLKAVYSVMLFDAVDEANPKFITEKRVRDGENLELTVLDIPDHTAEGFQFSRWWPSEDIFNPIVADTEIWAMYEPIDARTYTVRFFDINREEMEEYTQQVVEGGKATPPSKDEMEVEGKVFTGWDRDFTNITSDLDVFAQYSDRAAGKYYVTFWTDMDMTTMIGRPQEVNEGESAIEPAHPTKEGYVFSRWSQDGWQNVTKDLDIFAVYVEDNSNNPDDPNTPDDPNNPDNPNDPNTPNNPGSGNNGNNNGNNNNNGGSSSSDNSVSGNGTKYKVVVNGGSGSGEYTAGTIVPINAYARADGTVFDKWTSSSNGVGFVNQTAISTNFTMPANNVEITANYKTGSSSSVSGNSRSTRRNSTTTVDVTKGGISNTGLASANVNGSSDNYIIKITEDAQATAAVIAALEARYGDLSNIAYLPMDISLYDSTGQTKITDVSGISVDITLPLPDELIQYAGNNRAASVVNGRLEELGAKFTTIDGVPCIQFTATHFSPYTIYVDKANLSAGTVDATPKTGDPIHPKWFLAMGLACISIILFCKKDKGQPKVKAAV